MLHPADPRLDIPLEQLTVAVVAVTELLPAAVTVGFVEQDAAASVIATLTMENEFVVHVPVILILPDCAEAGVKVNVWFDLLLEIVNFDDSAFEPIFTLKFPTPLLDEL